MDNKMALSKLSFYSAIRDFEEQTGVRPDTLTISEEYDQDLTACEILLCYRMVDELGNIVSRFKLEKNWALKKNEWRVSSSKKSLSIVCDPDDN